MLKLYQYLASSLSIKRQLSIDVLLLVSIIVLGYTMVIYFQYVGAQKDKIINEAQTIISPFYDAIRSELPDEDRSINLYLTVALLSKEKTQIPYLINTHKELLGICFINNEGKEILRHGKVDTINLNQDKTLHLDNSHITVNIPFKMQEKNLGRTIMVFSSNQFNKEKAQILINGSFFLLVFLSIGLLGARKVGHSIATPIELLSNHIKHKQLKDLPLLNRQDEIGDFSRTITSLASSLEIREKELNKLAYFDELTKLPSRRLFIDRFEQMLSTAKRKNLTLAVLFLDLNKFKYVNDNYGHDTGDALLQQVADRMCTKIRKSDTLARISGDEFTLLLSDNYTERSIAIFCEKLFNLFEHPFNIKQRQIYISLSIGIALYPGDGEDVETLINNADRAMYHAKKIGGNQYEFYNHELQLQYRERLTIESSLRQAIIDESIDLHYQPQILLSSGEVCGIEALARWEHPTLGAIAPDKFITIAEEVGFIESLSELILQKACKQMSEWLRKGLSTETKIAVNLSSLDFINPNLISTIKKILTDTSLSPSNLEIEITETTTINQPEQVIKTTNSLNNMGISIVVDDFGVGYSSLSRLNMLKPSALKIDRSFVNGMDREKLEHQLFVKAIISMAQALNFNVVVEGVENKAQLNIISTMKVPSLKVQGYYFSKPLPAEEFAYYAKLV